MLQTCNGCPRHSYSIICKILISKHLRSWHGVCFTFLCLRKQRGENRQAQAREPVRDGLPPASAAWTAAEILPCRPARRMAAGARGSWAWIQEKTDNFPILVTQNDKRR